MTEFSDLGLIEPMMRALADLGYTRPTPIQAEAIPPALAGRDLVGAAQTGTGKTAAFALPLIQRLTQTPVPPRPKTIRALILAPTRELASQIDESIRGYARHAKVTSATAFGGVPIGRQRRALVAGLDVLVATPGRLLDLVGGRDLDLSKVEFLVLDEADRMLDLGFIHDLKRIAGLLPAARQSLFFSATMPPPIRELAGRFLKKDPVEVAVARVASAAETVDQSVVMVRPDRKPALLAKVIGETGDGRVIVFTRTKHGADRVVKQLAGAGIESAAIHGNKSQSQRERALDGFRDGSMPVLVATDIAARGIDVEGVELVVNYDLPNIAETYVHRIGRTGRAGADGRAVAFCAPEEVAYLRDIERLMRRRVFELPEPAGLEALAVRRPVAPIEPRGEDVRRPPQGREGRNDARSAQKPGRRTEHARDEAGAERARNEHRHHGDRPERNERPVRQERGDRPVRQERVERPQAPQANANRRRSDQPVGFGDLVKRITEGGERDAAREASRDNRARQGRRQGR